MPNVEYLSYKILKYPAANTKALNRRISEMNYLGGKLRGFNVIPWIKDERGFFRTSGNLALRMQGHRKGFIITGTEVDKTSLSERNVVWVHSINYRRLEMTISGSVMPSREVIIHDRLFSAFPETNIAIHIHDNVILNNHFIPTTKRISWSATLEDAKEVVKLMKLHKTKVINLRKHGQIIIGKSYQECMFFLFEAHEQSLHLLENELHKASLKNERRIISKMT